MSRRNRRALPLPYLYESPYQEGGISALVSLHEELRTSLEVKESVAALEKEVSELKEFLKDANRQLVEARKPGAQQECCSYANVTAKPCESQRNVRKTSQKQTHQRPRSSNIFCDGNGSRMTTR